MHVVRPVRQDDLARLVALAEQSGHGAGRAHRMPADADALGAAIARSTDAFSARVERPGDQRYLLVLERGADGALEGCASITALAGAGSTYFAFRRDLLRQVSVELRMAHEMAALTMNSELSRHSHLCASYVRPGVGAAPAALLARARVLLAAAAPHRFAERFFASLPGPMDGTRQPFWDAVGGHFFGMPLERLETMLGATRMHPAMVEMMPHYPIYVDLLAADAQAALGRSDAAAAVFRDALADEGFRDGRYAGLLDGGAVLHARRAQLRSFAAGARRAAAPCATVAATPSHIVANARAGAFRALLAGVGDAGGAAGLSRASMDALGLAGGDEVLCVEL
ncbi:MAG: arginine N-succinyltransferase [Pseudomonadota bacterium]